MVTTTMATDLALAGLLAACLLASPKAPVLQVASKVASPFHPQPQPFLLALVKESRKTSTVSTLARFAL
jgi:hypothetical protein